jgi:predicted SAM-dependent methyltransferase
MQLTQAANAELVKRPALEGIDRPPLRLLPRLRHYSRRYGLAHAVLSYAGRFSFGLWQLIGPAVTRPHLRRWLRADGVKILNLGGGNVLFDRWLTADVVPRADVHMNVTQPLPLPDSCLDAIYSEEVIEHISLEQGRAMLRECWRTLKPGGWLRITTPSLDHFARRALASPDHVAEINDIFYLHAHRHIYSEAELQREIAAAGFVNLLASSYRAANSRLGFLDSHPERHTFAPPEWSQYWEAQKPVSAPR